MTTATRQLIVLCDGTNNTLTGGVKDTNVLKLATHLRRHCDAGQQVWYDPGVGSNSAMPGVSVRERIQGHFSRLKGSAMGGGVYENIGEALTFLAQNHQSGDQIYLFGFSRGAFTARAVGGIINQYGLPDANCLHLLPLMLRQYFSGRKEKQADQRRDITAQTSTMAGCRQVDLQFVGVWDTVEAVGLPNPFFLKKITNSRGIDGKCFLNVRHAVALDEYRSLFKPRLYQPSPDNVYATRSGKVATLVQKAFAGCHSDVGGGYQRSGLSDEALTWMAHEAVACGLRMPALSLRARSLVIHSEIHTTPLWAATGQSVRDLRELQLSHLPPADTLSVWREHGLPKWPWWLWGAVLTAVGWRCLGHIDPQSIIPSWQTLAFWKGHWALPVDEALLSQHLWVDTLVFLPGLILLMSVLCGAAFARVAGRQSLGHKPPAFLNLLGKALPVYSVADLAENGLTGLVLHYTGSAAFWIVLMSIASAFKWLGLVGVLLLWVRGVVEK